MVTRDFQMLLAGAIISDGKGTFAEFFEGLSEEECTVFTEGFSTIVFEMLKAASPLMLGVQTVIIETFAEPFDQPDIPYVLTHLPTVVNAEFG